MVIFLLSYGLEKLALPQKEFYRNRFLWLVINKVTFKFDIFFKPFDEAFLYLKIYKSIWL